MRRRYRKRGWLCAILAAVLSLALALPQKDSLAREQIDDTQACTLKVSKENLENPEWTDLKELGEVQVEVYLYQIATVDLYGRYTFVPEFKDLAGKIPGGVVDIEALNKTVFEANTEEWEKTARWAADLLKLPVFQLTDQGGGKATPSEAEGADSAGEKFLIPERAELENLPCFSKMILAGDEEHTVAQGLYLVWAKPFMTAEYLYTFLPYLVSVPDNAYERASDSNAGTDDWIYDVTVGLKPERQERYLNLEIVKSLTTFDPAVKESMFVFQIDAVKGVDENGKPKTVYSDVVGLSFSEAGQKRALARKIPAGSVVTVWEVYSGASYKLTGWGAETGNPASAVIKEENQPGTVVIDKFLGASGGIKGETDDENGLEIAAKVTFVNDYDPDGNNGSGIVNKFTHIDGKWQGVQITGNQEGGAANE